MAYVYLHRRNDTEKVFYIGKGSGQRAWQKTRRNPHWTAVENKAGRCVEIVKRGLTDEEAFALETKLIEQHGGVENLTNMTEGGEGGYTNADNSEGMRKAWANPEWAAERRKAIRKARGGSGFRCEHGEEAENVYTFPNGKRTCRTCFRNRVREWRQRQKNT